MEKREHDLNTVFRISKMDQMGTHCLLYRKGQFTLTLGSEQKQLSACIAFGHVLNIVQFGKPRGLVKGFQPGGIFNVKNFGHTFFLYFSTYSIYGKSQHIKMR